MSSRRGFLKTIAMLAAAGPAIATSIEVKNISVATKKYWFKRGYWFKLTPELYNDKKYLSLWINDMAVNNKIDIKKPFDYKIGFVEDDFTNNLLTCLITQFQDEKGNAQS